MHSELDRVTCSMGSGHKTDIDCHLICLVTKVVANPDYVVLCVTFISCLSKIQFTLCGCKVWSLVRSDVQFEGVWDLSV
jgi:hypothetical protein